MAALEICVKAADGAPDVLGDCMSSPPLSEIIDLCFVLHQALISQTRVLKCDQRMSLVFFCSRPIQPTCSSDPRREKLPYKIHLINVSDKPQWLVSVKPMINLTIYEVDQLADLSSCFLGDKSL